MGRVIFITTISLVHFFRNSQHPERWSVSVKNLFRKNSLRKTSPSVLFELLPTGLLNDLLLPYSMNGLIIFWVFFGRTLMKK